MPGVEELALEAAGYCFRWLCGSPPPVKYYDRETVEACMAALRTRDLEEIRPLPRSRSFKSVWRNLYVDGFEACGFIACVFGRPAFFAPVAQLAEQPIRNRRAVGSNPAGGPNSNSRGFYFCSRCGKTVPNGGHPCKGAQ